MTRIRWTAERDGIGHVHIAGRHRTACGQPPIAERHAWPITTRCEPCTDAVAALTTGTRPGAPARAG